MQRLDVFDNELGGPIPNILSKWPFLAFFDVEKNQLTGSPFVDAIGLFNLQSYRVSLNAFVGGTIPADLVDKFPNLVELWLSNSTMIGSIPTEIALMDNLRTYRLAACDRFYFGVSHPTTFSFHFFRIYIFIRQLFDWNSSFRTRSTQSRAFASSRQHVYWKNSHRIVPQHQPC